MPDDKSPDDVYRVFAVVLAAGDSSRFGSTKQLQTIDGISLVERAAKLARNVCGDNTILVTGHDSAAVARSAGNAGQIAPWLLG